MDRSAHRRATCVLIAIAAACQSDGYFCVDDTQCTNAGQQGVCEPTGGCSFDDPDCDSGRRYGQHAPSNLAGQCVPRDVGSGDDDDAGPGSGSPTSPGTSSSGGSIDGAPDGGSTLDGDSSNTPITVTSTTDDGADTDPGLETGESSTGGERMGFFDAFDRPDSAAIGNGWIEKTAGAFRITAEEVVLDSVNGEDFRDNLFYRPLAEVVLDVEVTMVVQFTSDAPFGYPQMHLRVQPQDVATSFSLTSYAVFIDSGGNQTMLTVNRIDGPGFGPSQSTVITPAPNGTETYRLRGRVTGTDPVILEGFLEVWQNGIWEIRTEATLTDTSQARITDPGTVGAGGHAQLQYFRLDDFAYVDLGG